MRLIDADALIDDAMDRYCKDCEKRKGIKNGRYRIIYEIGDVPCRACAVNDMVDDVESAPTVEPTLYGYPIEHLEMIARVMAKENCTPEAVAQMLQNVGEVAKMVRDEMMEMLKESIERTCKGEANEQIY